MELNSLVGFAFRNLLKGTWNSMYLFLFKKKK